MAPRTADYLSNISLQKNQLRFQAVVGTLADVLYLLLL